MSEEDKASFKRFIDEVVNNKNLAVIDELIDPDLFDHNAAPDAPPGIEVMKQFMSAFVAAFPDLHSTLEDLVAEGDLVAGRMTTTGTHQGEFMGIPATNKKVTFSETHIVRISNGKAVDHWGISDNLSLMQQLGVIPSE